MKLSKKILNGLLAVSFVITVAAPLTGIHVHKLASVIFLLLTVVHTVLYRRQLGTKRILLLALVLAAFVSGVLGMIFSEVGLVLAMHKVISIAVVFFLGIHLFVFHRRFLSRPREC